MRVDVVRSDKQLQPNPWKEYKGLGAQSKSGSEQSHPYFMQVMPAMMDIIVTARELFDAGVDRDRAQAHQDR